MITSFKYDEEILIEFIDYIDIYIACSYQVLSENFIENHIDLFNSPIYWYYLFQHNHFSSEFVQRHLHRVQCFQPVLHRNI